MSSALFSLMFINAWNVYVEGVSLRLIDISNVTLQTCSISVNTSVSFNTDNNNSAIQCIPLVSTSFVNNSEESIGYLTVKECDNAVSTNVPSSNINSDENVDIAIMDNFLIEACLIYEFYGWNTACFELETLFLPLCSTSMTSDINISDIDNIITYNSSVNAEGAIIDGHLGITIDLTDAIITNGTFFELCLQNIIVDTDNTASIDIYSIGFSKGSLFGTSSELMCDADGLPCFDLFFPIDCAPQSNDDENYTAEHNDAFYGNKQITFVLTHAAAAEIWGMAICLFMLNVIFYMCCCGEITQRKCTSEADVSQQNVEQYIYA